MRHQLGRLPRQQMQGRIAAHLADDAYLLREQGQNQTAAHEPGINRRTSLSCLLTEAINCRATHSLPCWPDASSIVLDADARPALRAAWHQRIVDDQIDPFGRKHLLYQLQKTDRQVGERHLRPLDQLVIGGVQCASRQIAPMARVTRPSG